MFSLSRFITFEQRYTTDFLILDSGFFSQHYIVTNIIYTYVILFCRMDIDHSARFLAQKFYDIKDPDYYEFEGKLFLQDVNHGVIDNVKCM